MDAETFGGFCSLLIEQWLDPSGSLEQDEDQLALLARMSAKSWAKSRKQILALFTLNDDDRLSCEIVSEALERAQSRSESARKAVEVRESRKVESGSGSNDKQKKIERSSNSEGEGEGKRKSKKLDGINPSSSYPETFESFWLAWKGLGSKRDLNKAGSFKSWQKAIAKGVTAETLVSAVKEYGAFVNEREKSKPDMRDFIPAPETWLNQDRWSSEYPTSVTVAISGDPVNGRDFYWAEVKDGEGVERMKRLKIVEGKRTNNPFDEQEWRKK